MEDRDKGLENEAFKLWQTDTSSDEASKHGHLANQLFRHVFVQGYRAGLTEGREFAAALGEERFIVAAPASSELGIELSKIRDRLNALERKAHEHAIPTRLDFGVRGSD